MKERPILFSAPMVRALLDGSKTQTRRVLKQQPEPPRAIYGSAGADTTITPFLHRCEKGMGVAWRFQMSKIATGKGHHLEAHVIDHEPIRSVCPYGAPGDRLWVRETHRKIFGQTAGWIETDYRATYTHGDRLGDSLGVKRKWTPAIHMPRDASRITLEITGVRVERLQDMSEADASAEGVAYDPGEGGTFHIPGLAGCCSDSAVGAFFKLWESINGAGSVAANPWVWVVEFRVLPSDGVSLLLPKGGE